MRFDYERFATRCVNNMFLTRYHLLSGNIRTVGSLSQMLRPWDWLISPCKASWAGLIHLIPIAPHHKSCETPLSNGVHNECPINCSGVRCEFLHLVPDFLCDFRENAVADTPRNQMLGFANIEIFFVAIDKPCMLLRHDILLLFRYCYPAGFLSRSSGAYVFAHTFIFSKRYDQSILVQPSIRFHPRNYVRPLGRQTQEGCTYIASCGTLVAALYSAYAGSAAMRYGTV